MPLEEEDEPTQTPPAGPAPGTPMRLDVEVPIEVTAFTSERVDRETLEREFQKVDWKGLSTFTLIVDDQNVMRADGQRSGLGVQVLTVVDGAEFLARFPISVDTVLALLLSYHAGDGKWRHAIEWDDMN
jgi:hypothetical protein